MNNNKELVAEARAISAALLVARLGGVAFDRVGATTVDLRLLPTSLYSPAARLLVVPTIDRAAFDMVAASEAMRVAGADALIVMPEVGRNGPSLTIHVGQHRPGKAVWHVEQRLLVRDDGSAYLVPSSRSRAEHHACFAFTPVGLQAAGAVPWISDADRNRGLARADALVAAALEGR